VSNTFAAMETLDLELLRTLSLVQETAGSANPLLMRDLVFEARRAVRGLSSVAGLVRVARIPPWLLRPRGRPPSPPLGAEREG